jgi:hypothetical protein
MDDADELRELREDRRRALRRADALTLETQTCDEAVADLVRIVRQVEKQRDNALGVAERESRRCAVAEARVGGWSHVATDFVAKDPELVAVSLQNTPLMMRKEIPNETRMWVPLDTYVECRNALAFARAALSEAKGLLTTREFADGMQMSPVSRGAVSYGPDNQCQCGECQLSGFRMSSCYVGTKRHSREGCK